MSQTAPRNWLNQTLLACDHTGSSPVNVVVGQQLGAGGEGTVYLDATRPEFVLKILHSPSKDSEGKVRAMLAAPPQEQIARQGVNRFVQIAWPQEVLSDARGAYLGFTMRYADLSQWVSMNFWTNARERRKNQLEQDDRIRVHLAANLASVTAFVNQAGHALVDLKPLNVMADRRDGYVCLVDCDGFRIQTGGKIFPAAAYTPYYLAPEFHPTPTSGRLGEDQDKFALAVVIFELLDNGCHPFSGQDSRRPTDPIEPDLRIAKRRTFLDSASGIIKPPKSRYEYLPDDTIQMFLRALTGTPAQRPTSAEWKTHLFDLAQNRMVPCPADPKHWGYGKGCPTCAGNVQMPPGAWNRSRSAVAGGGYSPQTQPTSNPTYAGGGYSPQTQPTSNPTYAGGGYSPQAQPISNPTYAGGGYSPQAQASQPGLRLLTLFTRFWKPVVAVGVLGGSGILFAMVHRSHEVDLRNSRYLSLISEANALQTAINESAVPATMRGNLQGLESGAQSSLQSADRAIQLKNLSGADQSLNAAELTINSLDGLVKNMRAIGGSLPPESNHHSIESVATPVKPPVTYPRTAPPSQSVEKSSTQSLPLVPQPEPIQPAESVSPGTRNRLQNLRIRAQVVTQSLETIESAQAASGLGLRNDMASAKIRMQEYLSAAQAEVSRGRETEAQQSLDQAEQAIEQLESFLNIPH